VTPSLLFKVELDFDPGLLTPSQQLWYARLWTNINKYTEDSVMKTGNSSGVGFTGKHHVVALIEAFRVTHDITLLLQVLRYMKLLRNRISTFVIETDKDRAFIASMYALAAWVFHINREVDVFGEAADFWASEALKLCRVTNGTLVVPSDNLAHPHVASIETAYFLWKLTGVQQFLTQADSLFGVFNNEAKYINGALFWDQRMPITTGKLSLGWQESTYARYTIASFVTLWHVGYETVPMRELVEVVLRIIHEHGSLTKLMDGTGFESATVKQGSSLFGIVIPFDDSDEVARRNDVFYNKNVCSTIHIPASMLGTG